MNPIFVIGGFIGAFLLGVIGTQYYSINNLESVIEIKTEEGDRLKQANSQFQSDLQEADDFIEQMLETLNKERLIASEREQELFQNSGDLRAKLVQLEKEVSSHEGKESGCMHIRLPNYAIRLLGGITEDNHSN
ncbi:hypothetical protein [Xenorhabdus sp. PB30.3]|uniref:hypothetical protein n=1 Tax=Xenorhabdus sp. PB30.3 TaxID=2788941 RepID=UPI001E44A1BF|nr:hypothetical protein [Xenorhabdus sp. PB30.3]MCC8380088.1 hypothetical protein [Xenorhabdus sp. PB30.3]